MVRHSTRALGLELGSLPSLGQLCSDEIWRSSQKDIITLSCYISLMIYVWCNMDTDHQEW